jgi:hypothetical protein
VHRRRAEDALVREEVVEERRVLLQDDLVPSTEGFGTFGHGVSLGPLPDGETSLVTWFTS